MERQLCGYSVKSLDCSVRSDAQDIFRAQVAFIDPSRCDPDIAVFIKDRKVPTRQVCQFILVQPFHQDNQLIAWVHQFKLHRCSFFLTPQRGSKKIMRLFYYTASKIFNFLFALFFTQPARAVGKTLATISRIISGKRRPSFKLCTAIAKALEFLQDY